MPGPRAVLLALGIFLGVNGLLYYQYYQRTATTPEDVEGPTYQRPATTPDSEGGTLGGDGAPQDVETPTYQRPATPDETPDDVEASNEPSGTEYLGKGDAIQNDALSAGHVQGLESNYFVESNYLVESSYLVESNYLVQADYPTQVANPPSKSPATASASAGGTSATSR